MVHKRPIKLSIGLYVTHIDCFNKGAEVMKLLIGGPLASTNER